MIPRNAVPPEESESPEELRKSAEKAREFAFGSVDDETVEHLIDDAEGLADMADHTEVIDNTSANLSAPDGDGPAPALPVRRKRAPLKLKWQ